LRIGCRYSEVVEFRRVSFFFAEPLFPAAVFAFLGSVKDLFASPLKNEVEALSSREYGKEEE
jgi:hypothetical protein